MFERDAIAELQRDIPDVRIWAEHDGNPGPRGPEAKRDGARLDSKAVSR